VCKGGLHSPAWSLRRGGKVANQWHLAMMASPVNARGGPGVSQATGPPTKLGLLAPDQTLETRPVILTQSTYAALLTSRRAPARMAQRTPPERFTGALWR